jgi:cysteine desulfurase
LELNTKGRYAVMALADIARQGDQAAVPLTQVADRQHLPLAYLEQIFSSLRRAGLVDSARGRLGGYRLARGAGEIDVAAIMLAVDEETRFTRCSAGSEGGCVAGEPCLTHGLWQALGQVTSGFLASVTLADVISGKALAAGVAQARTAAHGPHRVYLDYNATAPLRPEAKAAMIAALDVTGNPSSAHSDGRKARAIIEAARESVARLVGAKPSEVVFTSGASESNAWVMGEPWDTIIVSGIEHDSVLAAARASGARVIEFGASQDGIARVEAIAVQVLTGGPLGRVLISLQTANNETGVIQPVAEVAAFAREHGLFVHTDAVQSAGRVALDFAGLGVDLMSLSAHKMGGPKGIGALIIKDHLDLVPLIRGGGQERRRRAGTENVAAIAGFGAAAEAAVKDLASVARIGALRDRLENQIRLVSRDTVILGADARRLANTSVLALPGRLSETLVIRLDLAGIAVSAGSACSSGKVGRSHVLDVMGIDAEIAKSAIRVSLGPETTEDDIAAFVAAWKAIADQRALAA